MKSITLRLNSEDDRLIRDYAKVKNMTVSELVRQSVLERIEDEIDLDIYNQAMKEHLEDPQDISFDEMMKELKLYE